MKVFLEQHQCPGDILMLTSAVRDLKTQYPYIDINVNTTANLLWNNNPHLTRTFKWEDSDIYIQPEYPLINSSDRLPYHFVHAFRKLLQLHLHLNINQGPFKGLVFLSELLKQLSPLLNGVKDYWIVDAGYKNDYTLKNWGYIRYQRLVNLLKDKVTFVQIGELSKGHNHKPLDGVINLVGKTSIRQFIQLMYRAHGVVSPVSFPMHLSAATPTPDGRYRPCIVLNGGRLPFQWVQYPGHIFLQNVGMFDCCRHGGCWRSRACKLNDGDEKDNSLCKYPVELAGLTVGKCMAMITPELVASYIMQFLLNR